MEASAVRSNNCATHSCLAAVAEGGVQLMVRADGHAGNGAGMIRQRRQLLCVASGPIRSNSVVTAVMRVAEQRLVLHPPTLVPRH